MTLVNANVIFRLVALQALLSPALALISPPCAAPFFTLRWVGVKYSLAIQLCAD